MDDPILRIKQQREEQTRFELEQARHDQEIASLNSIDTTIVEVMNSLVKFLDGKVTRTEVLNQIESVATPDVAKVVEAIAELGIITESNRIDLEPLKTALLGLGEKLDQLPKTFPEMPKSVEINNLSDIEFPEQKEIDFSDVIKAINNIKMNDLKPIEKGLTNGTTYNAVTTASTNAAVVKASAGNLYEISISNPTATAAYVKLYNKATSPTVGTDVPVMTIAIPATAAGVGEKAFNFGTVGKRFATGIGIACTAAAAATDTANAVAGVQINATYI